jgi:hypothetical protein
MIGSDPHASPDTLFPALARKPRRQRLLHHLGGRLRQGFGMRIDPLHQRPRRHVPVAGIQAKSRLALAVVMRRVDIPVEITVAHHGKGLHRVRAFTHAQDHAAVLAVQIAGLDRDAEEQAEPYGQAGWQETGFDCG